MSSSLSRWGHGGHFDNKKDNQRPIYLGLCSKLIHIVVLYIGTELCARLQLGPTVHRSVHLYSTPTDLLQLCNRLLDRYKQGGLNLLVIREYLITIQGPVVMPTSAVPPGSTPPVDCYVESQQWLPLAVAYNYTCMWYGQYVHIQTLRVIMNTIADRTPVQHGKGVMTRSLMTGPIVA